MLSDLDARLLRAAIALDGPVVPTSDDFEQWKQRAIAERVIPLLHVVVSRDGSALSDDQRALVSTMQLDVAVLSVRLEHDLLKVVEALGEAGIEYALLKGVAVAHLDYADPSWRQFGDVDVLVAPADVERAITTLGRMGWSTSSPVPRLHRRTTQAFVLRGDSLLEVDLHQRLRHRAPGWLVSTEDLLSLREPFELGDQTVWALCEVDRVFHACVHASDSRGGFHRLSSVADVLLLTYLCEERALEVIARADQFAMRGFVEHAVREAWSRAQLPLPSAWEAALTSPGRRADRLVERAHLGPRRRPVTEELALLRLLPGWRVRARYVWGYFAVGEEYRRSNGGRGLGARLKYLLSRIRSH